LLPLAQQINRVFSADSDKDALRRTLALTSGISAGNLIAAANISYPWLPEHEFAIDRSCWDIGRDGSRHTTRPQSYHGSSSPFSNQHIYADGHDRELSGNSATREEVIAATW
jgi:hypothetical protein